MVLCFVVVGVIGFASKAFANLCSVPSNPSIQKTSARDQYIRNCARCHGVDGRGQTDQGRKYDVPDLVEESKQTSSAKISKIIANGKLEMPAFGKKLSKKQIAALASYIKKL